MSEETPPPDELVGRLELELPKLIRHAVGAPNAVSQFDALHLPTEARKEIATIVSADTERILASTNTEIAALREAYIRLAEHEANRPSQVIQQAVSSVAASSRLPTRPIEPKRPHPRENRLIVGCLVHAFLTLAALLGVWYLAAWLWTSDGDTAAAWVLLVFVTTGLAVGVASGIARSNTITSLALRYAFSKRKWSQIGAGLTVILVAATIGLAFPIAELISIWIAIPSAVVIACVVLFVGLVGFDTAPLPLRSAEQERIQAQVSTASAGTDTVDRARRALSEAIADAHGRWREAARQSVLRSMRRATNTVADKWLFRIQLTDPRMPGLDRLHDLDFVVPSTWTDDFRRAVDSMNGGALGVAGPRGAGKSTVMAAHQSGLYLDAGRQHLSFVLQAPVEYQARDFALHMYARLCEEVRSLARRRLPGRPSQWGWRPSRLVALAMVAIILGVAVNLWAAPVSRTHWVARTQLAIACLAALNLLVAAWLARRRRRQHAPLMTMDREARRRLEQIRFLQTTTSGWSGKFSVPSVKTDVTRTVSRQLAGQPLTYPEVVSEFRDFLGDVVKHLSSYEEYARAPVSICIDELDKIGSSEAAQRFVNEVKALFGVTGCNFVVSVSEDALAAFERRGVPLRDEFDSAFDDIVRIDYLRAADSVALLQQRVTGVPDSFLYLCHCLTGGLPRDLLRITRRMVEYGARADNPSLAEVARYLVADDLTRMCHAARVAVQQGGTEPMLRHLEDVRRLTLAPETLSFDLLRRRIDSLADVEPARIQAETQCYLYFCGTILDFFDDRLTRNKLQTATSDDETRSLDLLGSARQMLAVSAGLGWLRTSDFRTAWQLPVLEAR